MKRILSSHIRRTVCTKGRLALAMTLTLVALFATVGALAQNYNRLPGSNGAGEPKSFITSLTSVPSMVMTRFFPQKSSQGRASISTAKKGYVPGEAVTFRGQGFRPGETVSLRITHLDGTAETSDLHNWQRITVGEDGTFTASISMPANGFGHDYVVAAQGEWSGASASAIYSRVAFIDPSKSSYAPGETAAIVGSYFANKEPVTIEVTDSAGNKLREPLVTYANEAGQIAASWLVSADQSDSSQVLVTAKGDLSGLTAELTLPTPATINPVTLPSVPCPSNLNSCTAKDVTTTVKAVTILNNDLCSSSNDTISLQATIAYAATSNERYDLGLFVSGDGGTIKEPSSALVCSGAAAQVGQGDNLAYPDADTDLFLDIDPSGHASTPSTPDTCGDLRATTGPVDWTINVTVECNIVANTLRIPSCRIWEQNANHGTSCQTLQQAGTGSKCDCTDLVVTTQLNPCATKICNDDNSCTDDSCVVSGTPGNLVGTCVFTNDDTNTCGSSGDTLCDNPDSCNAGVCRANNEPNTTVCRPAAAGGCDVPETCNGAGACPADGFAANTVSCTGTSQGGACDGADHCSGTSNTCVDVYQPATFTCRADGGACDVAEKCTGSSGACPADAFEPNTVSCTGTSSGGLCDGNDHCSGTANTCVDGFKGPEVVCRSDAGQCDVPENCSGSSGACPADAFELAGTACGSNSDSVCDNPDTCKGGENTCLPNYEAATTTCRPDAGDCDVAELCNGAGACPADGFEPAGTLCGDQTNTVCDNPDSCNASGQCANDNNESTSVVCRPEAGACDVAENCDGSGNCPTDAFDTPPTVTLGLNLLCENPGGPEQGGATPTQLVASASPNGSYSYSWTGPDGLPILDGQGQPITGNAITPTKPGTYTVVVTDTTTSCPNDAAFKLCFAGEQIEVASVAPTQQPQATASFTIPARSEPTGFRAYLAKLLSVFG